MTTTAEQFGNIEELALKDAIWQKVLDQERNTPQITVFSLMSRLSDAQVFVVDTLGLYEANSERLVEKKMQIVPQILRDAKYWRSTAGGQQWSPSMPDVVDLMTDKIEESTREKVEKHYPRWLFNQCRVVYCTILDSYLDSTVDAVFRQNPKILYGVSAGRNLDLKKIVELGSVEAIVSDIRAKEIRNFSNKDIADRLAYFDKKLSIETRDLFDWGYTEQDKERPLDGLKLDALTDLYQKRHDIVHRDATPISSRKELDIVNTLFLNVGFKLAMQTSVKHHVTWDITLMTTRNERYNALKAH
jgi:hypothetical protein